MTRQGEFTCKARRIYAGTPHEGFIALYGDRPGRPLAEVRDADGKRQVFPSETIALRAAHEALCPDE